ncbi:hypothetical protein A3Q56_07683, partial [Intoshia linei]
MTRDCIIFDTSIFLHHFSFSVESSFVGSALPSIKIIIDNRYKLFNGLKNVNKILIKSWQTTEYNAFLRLVGLNVYRDTFYLEFDKFIGACALTKIVTFLTNWTKLEDEISVLNHAHLKSLKLPIFKWTKDGIFDKKNEDTLLKLKEDDVTKIKSNFKMIIKKLYFSYHQFGENDIKTEKIN